MKDINVVDHEIVSPLKKVTSSLSLEITTVCPYCESFEDVTEDVKYSMPHGELSVENCDVEVECSECKKSYIVQNVVY